MTTPTVAVTCTANDQGGAGVAFAIYRAKLNQTEIYQGFVVPEVVEVIADANGVAILNLWPNALGVAGSAYQITARNPDTGKKFLDLPIVVPNFACNLHEITVLEPYPPIDASLQALAGAQSAAASANASSLAAGNSAAAAEADRIIAAGAAGNVNFLRTELASSIGAALVGTSLTPARTVQAQLDLLYYGSLNALDPEYAGGADPTGVVSASAALNALWANLKTFRTADAGDLGEVRKHVHIPAGKYLLDTSVNWTDLLAWNIHVWAEGAVFIGKCSGKAMFDCTAVRGLQWHGGLCKGDAALSPSCAVLVGPRNTEACGNNAFSNLKTQGDWTIAAFGNIGSETTSYADCYFQNSKTGATYGYAADGNHRLGFTSDYTTLRSANTAVSFTSNAFKSCRLATYSTTSTGAPFFGECLNSWSSDKGCYFLSFTGASLRIRADAAVSARNTACRFEGLFETSQAPGLDYVVEFIVPAGGTEFMDFTLWAGNPLMKTALIKMTNPAGGTPGNLSLANANISFNALSSLPALPMFDTCATMTYSGRIQTKAASNLNLGMLASFNGEVFADDFTTIGSAPVAGAYTFNSKNNNTAYDYGTHLDNTAIAALTPTITFATPGDLSVAYSVQSAKRYVRGKKVTVLIALTFTPTYTTASGEFRISAGLTAADAGTAQDWGLDVVNINTAWTWPASTTQLVPRLPSASASIRLYSHGATVASTLWTTANVPSGTAKSIIISGSYLTA